MGKDIPPSIETQKTPSSASTPKVTKASKTGKVVKKKGKSKPFLSSTLNDTESSAIPTRGLLAENAPLRNAIISTYPELDQKLSLVEKSKLNAHNRLNKLKSSNKKKLFKPAKGPHSFSKLSNNGRKFSNIHIPNKNPAASSKSSFFDLNWRDPMSLFESFLFFGTQNPRKKWMFKSEDKDSSFSVPWIDPELIEICPSSESISPEDEIEYIPFEDSLNIINDDIDQHFNNSEQNSNHNAEDFSEAPPQNITNITPINEESIENVNNEVLPIEESIQPSAPSSSLNLLEPIITNTNFDTTINKSSIESSSDSKAILSDPFPSPAQSDQKVLTDDQCTPNPDNIEFKDNKSYNDESITSPILQKVISPLVKPSTSDDILITDTTTSASNSENDAPISFPKGGSVDKTIVESTENSADASLEIPNEFSDTHKNHSLSPNHDDTHTNNQDYNYEIPTSHKTNHEAFANELVNDPNSAENDEYMEFNNPQKDLEDNLQLISNQNLSLDNMDYLLSNKSQTSKNHENSLIFSNRNSSLNFKNIPLSIFNNESHNQTSSSNSQDNIAHIWPTKNMYDVSHNGTLSSIFKRPSDKPPHFHKMNSDNLDYTTTSVQNSSKKMKVESFDSFSSCLSAIGLKSNRRLGRSVSLMQGTEKLKKLNIRNSNPPGHAPYFGVGYRGESSPFQKLNINYHFSNTSGLAHEPKSSPKISTSKIAPELGSTIEKNSQIDQSLENSKSKQPASVTAKVLLNIIKSSDSDSINSPMTSRLNDRLSDNTNEHQLNPSNELINSKNSHEFNGSESITFNKLKGPQFQFIKKQNKSPRKSLQPELLSSIDKSTDSTPSLQNRSMDILFQTAPEEVKSRVNLSTIIRQPDEIPNDSTNNYKRMHIDSDNLQIKNNTEIVPNVQQLKSHLNNNKKFMVTRSRRQNGYSMFSTNDNTQDLRLPFQSSFQIRKKKALNVEMDMGMDIDVNSPKVSERAITLSNAPSTSLNQKSNFNTKILDSTKVPETSTIQPNQISTKITNSLFNANSPITSFPISQSLESSSLFKPVSVDAPVTIDIHPKLEKNSNESSSLINANANQNIFSIPKYEKQDLVTSFNAEKGGNLDSNSSNLLGNDISIRSTHPSTLSSSEAHQKNNNFSFGKPALDNQSTDGTFVFNKPKYANIGVSGSSMDNLPVSNSARFSHVIKEMLPKSVNEGVDNLPSFKFIYPNSSKSSELNKNNKASYNNFTFSVSENLSKNSLTNKFSHVPEFNEIYSLILNLNQDDLPQYKFNR
ncbi:hypothetical protein AYI70_g6790 [Smittium culicis]|uniref:Uncharacterized protein n=1 Tax=Smittium culicis TaxID=133412 RepID=A0A1R1XNC2_9FUNG|nr:hypothetical protein AYI70_g6790 [Smittium culicis]